MAITDVNLAGYVRADNGTAVSGITISLLHASTDDGDIDGGAETTTTTNSTGYWSFTETSLDANYDIKITGSGGTQVRYIPWVDEITLKTVDTAVLKVRGADTAGAPIYLFADKADEDIDVWRINAANGGILTFDSRASGSSDGDLVAQMTITPHATVASSSVTIPGILDVNGSVDWDVTDVQVDSSGDIDLVSTSNAAAAIYLQENGGTSGTIKIHADQGTSESSIQLLSDAGGVDINAATGKDVDIAGGTVNLTSSDNAASAIYLRANAGTSETIKIHADQGTGAASIAAVSDVGGITLDAGLDIVLSADGGNITMDDGTSTIFDFNVDDTTLTIHDDQDTGDKAVITMAQHGALSIVTTDDDAAAANIQITADGTVDIDSAGILTLDSGAAINIEPAAGSAILLDGTISIDGGVVTGATSITSTAFVGALTGDASGTAATVTGGTQASITTAANLVTVGALNAGSITSGFTSIDVGSGAITTTGAVATGALTTGTDGSGVDVIFYSGTAGDNLKWDASDEVLEITGTDGATALDVKEGDVRVVDTLYLYDRGGESISSDGTELTLTSGDDIFLTATGAVKIADKVGIGTEDSKKAFYLIPLNTQDVSTSATTISGATDFGVLTFVTGEEGITRFADLVIFGYDSVTVISSHSVRGSPTARTYSVSGQELKLAMDSGTYDISVLQVLGPDPT
jgi:hypothetical protein